nr:polysaccharide pyruvyl transferase family protein [uncultured Caproiciproducens sp.]
MLEELHAKNLECTGCGACYNVCPVDAIKMEMDTIGFLQPIVQKDRCINCGRCLQTCPVLTPDKNENISEPDCYAAAMSDVVRLQSSSGGIFTALAEVVLAKGGAVYGAALAPDFSVRHICVKARDELPLLRKSKYVQSDTGLTYREIKEQLQNGHAILFSGCPCQVAGLKAYLGKEYDNLYTVDILCHGVPSQKMLKEYIQEMPEGNKIISLDFRPKEKAWSASSRILKMNYEDGTSKLVPFSKSEYEQGFHNGLILRNSCENCSFAEYPRQGDISLGDFWGIGDRDISMDDEGGTSAVLVNSPKGQVLLQQAQPQFTLCKRVPRDWLCDNRVTAKRTPSPYKPYFQFLMGQIGFTQAVKTALAYRFAVGIVGPWMNINCGGALTYYALFEALRDMGYFPIMISQPEGLDWDPTPKYCRYKKLPYPSYAIAPVKESYVQQREFNNNCDTFLVGSDQLFTDEMLKLLDGYADLEWVSEDKRKVAYATSFAYDTFHGTYLQKERLRYFLQRFDDFSVREESGVALAKKEFDVEAEWVLDPVFLCATSHFEKLSESGMERVSQRPYVFGYVLDPDFEKANAMHFTAEKLGAECYAASDVWNNPDKLKRIWDIETFDQLGNEELIAQIVHCRFLITDSFHGMCFAILFHKPFVAIANQERGKARFASLLRLLGLEDRMVHNPAEIEKAPWLFETIDYESVDKRLEIERDRCRTWLKNALEKPLTHKAVTDYDMACGYCDRTQTMIERRMKQDRDSLNGRVDWLIGYADANKADEKKTDVAQWKQLEDHNGRLTGLEKLQREGAETDASQWTQLEDHNQRLTGQEKLQQEGAETDASQWMQLEDHRKRLDSMEAKVNDLQAKLDMLEQHSIWHRPWKK